MYPDVETASDEYARRFSGGVGQYFLGIQTKITLQMMAFYPKATVLDVGGGHAQLAKPLAEAGYSITVTGSHNVCKSRLDGLIESGVVSFQTCDMFDLPFELGQFDVVMAFRLLPHVAQWQRLISEMCRVSGKAVIFDYPDIRSFNVLYKLLFSTKKALERNTRPFHLFSRRIIANEIGKHGFGKLTYEPEFFIPMVVHRTIGNVIFSKFLEDISGLCGMTASLGSPVIVRGQKVASDIK